MAALINEVGNKYGKLTVVQRVKRDNKTTEAKVAKYLEDKMKHNKAYRLKKAAHAKINKEAKELNIPWEVMNNFWSYVLDMGTDELLEHWEWKKEGFNGLDSSGTDEWIDSLISRLHDERVDNN